MHFSKLVLLAATAAAMPAGPEAEARGLMRRTFDLGGGKCPPCPPPAPAMQHCPPPEKQECPPPQKQECPPQHCPAPPPPKECPAPEKQECPPPPPPEIKEVVKEVPGKCPPPEVKEVVKEVPGKCPPPEVKEVIKEVPKEVIKEVPGKCPPPEIKEVVKEVPGKCPPPPAAPPAHAQKVCPPNVKHVCFSAGKYHGAWDYQKCVIEVGVSYCCNGPSCWSLVVPDHKVDVPVNSY